MPPKVKCVITGEFHYYNDVCNCEDVKDSKAEELKHIKKMLSEPLMCYQPDDTPKLNASELTSSSIISIFDGPNLSNAIGTTEIAACTICVRCAVCEKEVAMSWYNQGVYVCEDCKKAVKFIKEKFKEELNTYEV
jgi:hypothetical protein